MNNEEFQLLMLEQMKNIAGQIKGLCDGQKSIESKISNIENRLETIENRLDTVENRLSIIDNRLDNLEQTVVRIENQHGEKISALYEGFLLHENKFEKQQHHMEEWLDAIHLDLSYLV